MLHSRRYRRCRRRFHCRRRRRRHMHTLSGIIRIFNSYFTFNVAVVVCMKFMEMHMKWTWNGWRTCLMAATIYLITIGNTCNIIACLVGMRWHSMSWYGMVWYGMVWHGNIACTYNV